MSDRTRLNKNWGVISLVIVGAALLLGAFVAAAPPLAAPVARVQSVRGQLFVRRKGANAYTPLKVGKTVFGGDVVRTGARSRAVILLTNRAELELGASMAMQMPLPVDPAKVLLRDRDPFKSGANR